MYRHNPQLTPLELVMQQRDGSVSSLMWNPKTCLILDPATGRQVDFPRHFSAKLVEYDAGYMPGNGPHTMAIQLGRECNFRCDYCCQGQKPAQPEAPITDAQIHTLLASLEAAHKKHPRIAAFSFWGGEPLLYKDALVKLAEGIRAFCPHAALSMITNGSLLDVSTCQWLVNMGVNVGISHDGPDNACRSDDVLAPGSVSRSCIDSLVERTRGTGQVSLNPIFTAHSPGQKDVAQWFAERFGEDIPLGEGAPCFPPDLEHSGLYLSGDQLPAYAGQMLLGLIHSGHRYASYSEYVKCFLRACMFPCETPRGGMCGAYSKLPFSVTMDGEVLFCHNFPRDYVIPWNGKSNLRGHIDDIPGLLPHGLPGWEQRERCHKCPVLPLCRGGCPLVDDAVFEKQCAIRFHHNLALLGWGLFLLTGKLLTGVYGDYYHAPPTP